jgi:membrane protease subunit HflC
MQNKGLFFAIFLFPIILLGAGSLFIVSEVQNALVVEFGKIVKIQKDPGLHFKIPLIQDVLFLEKRMLNINIPEREVIAADQKRMIIDLYAKYQIKDPEAFYLALNNRQNADMRIASIVDSTMRGVIAKYTLLNLLSNKRPEIMKQITDSTNKEVERFGIYINDVRIMKADLPAENSNAVFSRMETERITEASELRAIGDEEYQKIKSEAERKASEIVSNARMKAEIMKGQADAESARIFNLEISKDPEFYEFYRTMNAYKEIVGKDDTQFIISKKDKIFHSMKNGK